MSLALLTQPEFVRAAMEEYDRLGSAAFLRQYGYGQATSFFLVENGRLYDSKAIVGVAVGKEHPERGPLRSGDFSGGESTVKVKLESLGFTVERAGDAPSDEGPLTPPLALLRINAVLGEPRARTAKLAAWQTLGGHEMALQLDVSGVNLWTEVQPPPDPNTAVKQYLPEKSRHSNLRGLASRLSQPFEAWLSYVRTCADLDSLKSRLPLAAALGEANGGAQLNYFITPTSL